MTTVARSAQAAGASVQDGLSRRRRDVPGTLFLILLLGSLLFSLAILFILLADVLTKASPVFAERGADFLTAPLSSNPSKAGVGQGIIGTAILGVIVALTAFPFGIATATYLEEYARDSRLTRFIQVNIRNLAGVPSVVYGLLGLSVFVALFESLGLGNGRNVLAGGATLAVLVLPIVIITSIEALRAVPNSIREAGYGVGASRWEVTRHLVLPAAAPGVLTGTVLALSRALGETAPLVLAGAVLGSFSADVSKVLTGSYTALPAIVYDWSRKPQDAFRADAAAAIVVLLAITLLANAIAIYLRNRYERTS
ncbi:MAG TPA: phosphate ABC transporter permease PstA [Candidatus Limnocylindrales bacterium]|jgi:phosphate transport system permease protein|nr:phosphate ABC transporter permease PstA [Candidatus Limnocylindrales bacterium]